MTVEPGSSGRVQPRSKPTQAEREACRVALRKQIEERAEEQFLNLSRTLSCLRAFHFGEEHPTCLGNYWKTDTTIVCLCECHDEEATDV